MATLVWKDCKIYWHEFDLSAVHNELSVAHNVEALDDTAYGDDTRTRKAGLKDWEVTASGWWEAGAGEPDTVLYTDAGTAGRILTIAPTGADNTVGYFSSNVLAVYSPMAQTVGELQRFTFSSYSEDDLRRGTILQPIATKSASSAGTARELGAVAAGQSVYGAIHCTSASAGDTLDVIVRSDSLVGMGTPTTRLTFTQVSGGTEMAEIQSAAGAITDTWWQVSYTIAGDGSEAFDFIVIVAIM